MEDYLSALSYFCRTCMRIPKNLIPLSDDPQLTHKIETISSVTIDENDQLPKKICEECLRNINLFYNFRKVIINNDSDLKSRLAAVLLMPETMPTPSSDDVIEETVQIVSPMIVSRKPRGKKKPRQVRDLNFKNIITYKKKSYECKPCGFVCSEISKWQNHKRTNHYARGICNICGKSLRTDNLNKHIKSHMEDPITCKDCGKVFKNSESLRSHALIHNGPALLCTLCGKSYKYRGEYNRHMKRHSCK
uniref:C2H2-type domain-containing protein n=1 Tax=Photinus pyralis TaxID=7054 RepID=A0A1Y1M684_PHOPY